MHIDDSKKFDKRNVQRNIKDGIFTQKDYDGYLSKLPDVGDKACFPEAEPKEAEIKADTAAEPRKAPGKKKPKGK
jgi:hypothetical protein